MGLMPRQPEVPANWLHRVHLAGLGGGPQVLAQPGGEAGLPPLAADADIGGCEPAADPRVLPAEQEVNPCRLAGDVLGDSDGGPGEGAGVGVGVLAMKARGAVAPPAALVEAR